MSNYNRVGIKENWSSIKICIRNGYIVKDASTYLDYLVMLKYFNRDMLNAFYVCPKNINRAHDRLVEKKQEITRMKKLKEKREMIESDQVKYENEKGQFFGLVFNQDNVSVKVFDSVELLLVESEILHHCAYENNYHKKKESLLLSARVDDKPIETVELSLEEMKVIQCRGLFNKPSEFHEQIVNLVNSNVHHIQKVLNQPVSH